MASLAGFFAFSSNSSTVNFFSLIYNYLPDALGIVE